MSFSIAASEVSIHGGELENLLNGFRSDDNSSVENLCEEQNEIPTLKMLVQD